MRFVLIVLALTFFTIAPAFATPADPQEVKRIEQYLNSITTMSADFVQEAPNGDIGTGKFYLNRPGRLRFQYEKPIKNYVVADGRFIHFWDAKVKQQSTALIGDTLADLILQKQIKLTGEVVVTNYQRVDNVIEVTVTQAADPGKGSMVLVLEDQPLQLRKWRVYDAQGQETKMSLLNPKTGEKFDQAMFRFTETELNKNR